MAKDVSQSQLIAAVQMHPAIWDLSHPGHGDRVSKRNNWNEICCSLTEDWDEMSQSMKKDRLAALQSRWKSLVDRIRREVKDKLLTERSGAPSNIRPHPLAEELSFLRRSMESRATTSNWNATEADEEIDQREGNVSRATASPNVSTLSTPSEVGSVDLETEQENRVGNACSSSGGRGRGNRQQRNPDNSNQMEQRIPIHAAVRSRC
ncbi:uncharacterized protein LOC143989529 [Lithobates pipiens]